MVETLVYSKTQIVYSSRNFESKTGFSRNRSSRMSRRINCKLLFRYYTCTFDHFNPLAESVFAVFGSATFFFFQNKTFGKIKINSTLGMEVTRSSKFYDAKKEPTRRNVPLEFRAARQKLKEKTVRSNGIAI